MDEQRKVMNLYKRSFGCMTTEIELFLESAEPQPAKEALARIEQFFRSVEARFSRFLPDSELSRLNDARGGQVSVSPELSELMQLALTAAQTSHGIFDPTIIDALEAAGYDRSIDQIREQGTQVRAPSRSIRPGRWRKIHLDAQAHTVTLPADLRLDLGGIGKGWAADRAAAMLQPLGAGLVNAGGDLRAWGDQLDAEPGQGWVVAVDDPFWPGGDLAWMWVKEGALATSTTARRRWLGGHHLVDPRTGRPAETDLVSASVSAPTTVQAEVAAKVVLILGSQDGLAWLAAQPGLEALLVTNDSQIVSTPGIPARLAWIRQGAIAQAEWA